MAQPDFLYSLTNNPLFGVYFFYVSILLLKVLFMSTFTAITRARYGIFANPEDAALKKLKVSTNDKVERIRRAHLNDLENIIPFIFISFSWLLTNPSYKLALYLFRTFTLVRLLHTFVYTIVVLPQPSRAICWSVGYLITVYMLISTLLYFW